jgi:hypothetical protein
MYESAVETHAERCAQAVTLLGWTWLLAGMATLQVHPLKLIMVVCLCCLCYEQISGAAGRGHRSGIHWCSRCMQPDDEHGSMLTICDKHDATCSASSLAPLAAASVPFLNGVRLVLVGCGVVSAPTLVAAMSRSKDREELLQGPLIYTIVLTLATVLSWRTHIPGLCMVAMMCGGDGLADLVGRRMGTARLPWNTRKSWAGSFAMFAGGFLLMCGCVAPPMPC